MKRNWKKLAAVLGGALLLCSQYSAPPRKCGGDDTAGNRVQSILAPGRAESEMEC